mgnify:CR=1 FL=1
MFKIGDFSKICRIPVSALRYYADIGLLEPAHISPETGYRYYSLEQLPQLNRILALKDLGLTLEQIKDLLSEELPVSEMRGMLKLKASEMQEMIHEQQAQLARVQARLQQIEQEESGLPELEVILKDIPGQAALTVRTIIPVGEAIEAVMMECAGIIMSQKLKIISPPMTIFHDGEFKEKDLDIEIAFPVENTDYDDFVLSEGQVLSIRTLESIPQVASIIHTGAYERFAETYEIIGHWIERNQYNIAGAIREIYLRPPSETEEAITEIQFPIEKD